MTKFLITGSNGFFGSHIVEYLNSQILAGQDYQMTGLDSHEPAFPFETGALQDIRGDIRDTELVKKLVKDAD